jgi:hypothetical protein
MSNLAETCLDLAGIRHRSVVFRQVPSTTFAVTFDSVSTLNSADTMNNVYSHSCTVELYEQTPDPSSRANFEQALDRYNLTWERSDTTWISDEQLYQTIYTFNYTEKRRA